MEASQLGAFARGSAWAYPAANLVHLLGLVLLLGGIGVVDLRIIGAFRALPIDAVMRAFTPLAICGLALLALSGPILFAADAIALSRSDVFARKLVLIVIALLNAFGFRWIRRGRSGEAGVFERVMALASILLWLTVAALGRLIAYN
ncbi:DUF6644 family protein [Sphingomonas colocasiae]|uniref:DUF6644 domain-containing protein n=1 Tax=Sphingomonas colocasiae TaxID=1848973 RepID=A0ABS7PXR6_9SPHN|nr:DUF6644 family protein [Sphingomonas colocasiae]MBY8825946.1 hypothetical protein [Sphingomonas colocasiae]